jgi:hypothetical protein
MLMMPRQSRNLSFLDKSELLKLRMKAMRSGVWFKAFSIIDKVLVDLKISVACKVRSITLAECIFAVTRNLYILFESEFSRTVRSICFPTAFKLQCVSSEMGQYERAKMGKRHRFIRYLVIMKLCGNPLMVVGGK